MREKVRNAFDASAMEFAQQWEVIGTKRGGQSLDNDKCYGRLKTTESKTHQISVNFMIYIGSDVASLLEWQKRDKIMVLQNKKSPEAFMLRKIMSEENTTQYFTLIKPTHTKNMNLSFTMRLKNPEAFKMNETILIESEIFNDHALVIKLTNLRVKKPTLANISDFEL